MSAQLADALIRIEELESQAVTASDLEDDYGITGDLSAVSALAPYLEVDSGSHDIELVGANVHIRSGTGSTEGDLNGLGNLIVGYNKDSSDARTGSHNLIVGSHHSYSSFGGFVAGYDNALSAPYASAAGGRGNMAGGNYAFVGGGY